MKNNEIIEILLKDNWTRKEAEKAVKNDNIMLWNNKAEFLQGLDESEKESASCYFDYLPCVDHNGKKYYIEFTG